METTKEVLEILFWIYLGGGIAMSYMMYSQNKELSFVGKLLRAVIVIMAWLPLAVISSNVDVDMMSQKQKNLYRKHGK